MNEHDMTDLQDACYPEREHDGIIGTPETDIQSWDGVQSYDDTCAIRCQEFILEQFTGMEFDEHALVAESARFGWYAPGHGTDAEHVGNLLELHGVAVNRYEHASVYDLAAELAQGHKVMVGVHSNDLLDGNSILQSIGHLLGLHRADHAVVVGGIDTSDPENIRVIVSDPGTGNPAASYPLDEFVDAWKDSGFHMIATRDPAPASLPEMANFDYGLGHLPAVMGVPYIQKQTENLTARQQGEPIPHPDVAPFPTEGFPQTLNDRMDQVRKIMDPNTSQEEIQRFTAATQREAATLKRMNTGESPEVCFNRQVAEMQARSLMDTARLGT